ncbi:cytochrome c [Tardiphaga sp. vice278]|nr:cytochrome c [Tardiphaga sp. vice278]
MPSPVQFLCHLLSILSLAGLLLPSGVSAADGRDIALHGNGTGAHACASCHGEAGEGIPADGYPRLSGLSAAYLVHQLESFADGKRSKAVMTPIANALTPEDRQAVADYYTSQSSANGRLPNRNLQTQRHRSAWLSDRRPLQDRQRSSQPRHRRAIAVGLPKARPQSRGLRTTLTIQQSLDGFLNSTDASSNTSFTS